MVQKTQSSRRVQWRRDDRLTLRDAQRADRAAIDRIVRAGTVWDLPAGETADAAATVAELDHRVVAVARSLRAYVEPQWAAEPLPHHVPELTFDRPPNAVVANGLVILDEVPPPGRRQIHRLTRTLLAQQFAARWALTLIPLPDAAPHGPAGIVQQVCAGALVVEPLKVVLEDGYWPIGLSHDGAAVACVWRNDAM